MFSAGLMFVILALVTLLDKGASSAGWAAAFTLIGVAMMLVALQ